MRKTFVDLGQPEAQVSGTVQRQPAGFAYSIQKDCGKRFKGSTAETPLLVTTYKMYVTRLEICKLLILHNPAEGRLC